MEILCIFLDEKYTAIYVLTGDYKDSNKYWWKWLVAYGSDCKNKISSAPFSYSFQRVYLLTSHNRICYSDSRKTQVASIDGSTDFVEFFEADLSGENWFSCQTEEELFNKIKK